MRVLVWCGLKQAENEPNTTHVSEQRLSLAENLRIQKRAFLAGFQAGNSMFKNPSTGLSFPFLSPSSFSHFVYLCSTK